MDIPIGFLVNLPTLVVRRIVFTFMEIMGVHGTIYLARSQEWLHIFAKPASLVSIRELAPQFASLVLLARLHRLLELPAAAHVPQITKQKMESPVSQCKINLVCAY
jgi:hypothetical protein